MLVHSAINTGLSIANPDLVDVGTGETRSGHITANSACTPCLVLQITAHLEGTSDLVCNHIIVLIHHLEEDRKQFAADAIANIPPITFKNDNGQIISSTCDPIGHTAPDLGKCVGALAYM